MSWCSFSATVRTGRDPNLQCRKCDEVARRYGKEIAVVEPVKGGALMNLPEEAAVLLYQADATA